MPNQNIGTSGSRHSLAIVLVVLALMPTTLFAWGSMGHRIVAEVAQRHLEPSAARRVNDILDGRTLPELATWPDDIRSTPSWSCAGPFHYVTVPPAQSYFEYNEQLWHNAQLPQDERLPLDEPPDGDSLRALVYFETVLSDSRATHEARRNALSFLVHLVGDMHQPLHNGRGCDRGGNSVKVDYFGDETNLHVVWDEKLIESERLSFTEFAGFVDHVSKPEFTKLTSATPMDWVNQSQRLLDDVYTCDASSTGDRCTCFCGDCSDGQSVFGGCKSAMCTMVQAGPVNLKYGYKARNIGTLKEQLRNGGVRLAGMLNWILSKNPRKHPGYDNYQAFKAEVEAMPDWNAPVQACLEHNQRNR